MSFYLSNFNPWIPDNSLVDFQQYNLDFSSKQEPILLTFSDSLPHELSKNFPATISMLKECATNMPLDAASAKKASEEIEEKVINAEANLNYLRDIDIFLRLSPEETPVIIAWQLASHTNRIETNRKGKEIEDFFFHLKNLKDSLEFTFFLKDLIFVDALIENINAIKNNPSALSPYINIYGINDIRNKIFLDHYDLHQLSFLRGISKKFDSYVIDSVIHSANLNTNLYSMGFYSIKQIMDFFGKEKIAQLTNFHFVKSVENRSLYKKFTQLNKKYIERITGGVWRKTGYKFDSSNRQPTQIKNLSSSKVRTDPNGMKSVQIISGKPYPKEQLLFDTLLESLRSLEMLAIDENYKGDSDCKIESKYMNRVIKPIKLKNVVMNSPNLKALRLSLNEHSLRSNICNIDDALRSAKNLEHFRFDIPLKYMIPEQPTILECSALYQIKTLIYCLNGIDQLNVLKNFKNLESVHFILTKEFYYNQYDSQLFVKKVIEKIKDCNIKELKISTADIFTDYEINSEFINEIPHLPASLKKFIIEGMFIDGESLLNSLLTHNDILFEFEHCKIHCTEPVYRNLQSQKQLLLRNVIT